MKKNAFLLLSLSFVTFLGVAACNGTFGLGSAASILPDDISLDIDELPDDESADAKSANAEMPINGPHAHNRSIRATGFIIHAFHRTAARYLALGAAIKDDITSPDQTQVAGTFTFQGHDVAYRADFSAFDIDGDAVADGSGVSSEDPVAVRMWVDRGEGFSRFLCALVTTRPSSDNIGAGHAYVKPAAVDADASNDLQLFFKWDRTDPAHKWNEAFIVGRLSEHYAMSASHQRVDVRTYDDDSLEKTVRSSNTFTDNPFGFENTSFSTHFRRDGDVALISGEASGGTTQISFTDVCILLADGSLAADGQCDDFDKQDTSLLDTPAGTETEFPVDFPENPTFEE